MSVSKNIILTSLSLAIGVAMAAPATAQLTPGRRPMAPIPPVEPVLAELEAGATVTDANGGAVGTIASVDGDFVILQTDKHEVRLPSTSFTATADGFLFGMTQAQLNAEVEKSMAKPADFVTVGAVVRDVAGDVVGTIEEVDTQFATLMLATNSAVKLPLNAFGAGLEGPIIGVTKAELEAQAAAAAGVQ